MKATKYVWILGLIALMAMGLVACGGDDPTATPTARPQATATPTAMMEAEPADDSMMMEGECPDDSKPEIVFTDLDWTSALIQAAIAEKIVNLGYCYPTDGVLLSTIPGFQALINGDTHISMEIWIPNQSEGVGHGTGVRCCRERWQEPGGQLAGDFRDTPVH